MPGGRPTKKTPDVERRILAGIAKGLTLRLACQYGGISYETFNTWRQEKPEFLDKVHAAEGEAAAKLAEAIRKASIGSANVEPEWRAAAWLLERRHPEDYGRKTEIHGAGEGGSITIQIIERDDGPQ